MARKRERPRQRVLMRIRRTRQNRTAVGRTPPAKGPTARETALAAQIAGQYSESSPDRQILLEKLHERVEVLADPHLLRIALAQLLENACKYSVPGSTVTIVIERQGDSAAVRVSNTGSSIPYSERSRIFERFYRGADASRTTSGSGLGLHVARKIAIAHGGALDLEIQSRQSGNVTFSLRIPAGKGAANRVVAAK